MIKVKTGKWFAFSAAIWYALGAVLEIVSIIIVAIGLSKYGAAPMTRLVFEQLIDLIVMIGLSVTLFTRNKIAVLCAASVQVSSCIVRMIAGAGISGLLSAFPYLAIIALIVLVMKRQRIAPKLWFLPAVIGAVAAVSLKIYNWYNFGFDLSDLFAALLSMLAAVPFLLVGLWLKADFSAAKATPQIASAPDQPAAPPPYRQNTVIPPRVAPDASSIAADLKVYKELLDSGIITQEDFDAKKKQLLGLD